MLLEKNSKIGGEKLINPKNLHCIIIVSNDYKIINMRKADLISEISDKTGIPKVDVMVTLETMFKEIKKTLIAGENIYIRGFGSFITKKRAAKK